MIGKKKRQLLGAAFFGALLLLACAQDKAKPKGDLNCDETPHTFAADVQPILTTYCSLINCHSSAQDDGGIPLNNYDDAVWAAGFDEFLKAIKHEPGAEPMPDGEPKLPQEDIDTIECWVLAGTPDN